MEKQNPSTKEKHFKISKKVWLALSIVLTFIVLTIIIALPITFRKTGQVSTEYDVIKLSKMKSYTQQNAVSQKNRNVFIGDSIIEGFAVSEFFNDEISYNRGISGDTSDRLLARLDDNAVNLMPKNIVILIGTNDLSRAIESDIIAENIRKICDKMRVLCQETKVIVCAVLPVQVSINPNMVGRRNNAAIAKLNEKIKEITQRNNAWFLDTYTPLLDNDKNLDKDFTYDGLHLNYNGYLKLSEAIKPMLKL